MNWLAYFKSNRLERNPIPLTLDLAVDPALRAPLGRSLQRFQLGESGEGRHLRALAAATGDPDYARAIDLFVAEEQEHARLLGLLLDGLAMPRLTGHWSDAGFVRLRRLAGLRLELAVLLIAEAIAVPYFQAVRGSSDDAALRTVCDQILHDEEGHIAFHTDTLGRAFAEWSAPRRQLTRAAWMALFRLALLVVMADHGGFLRAAGVAPRAFWRMAIGSAARVSTETFAPGPRDPAVAEAGERWADGPGTRLVPLQAGGLAIPRAAAEARPDDR